MLVVTLFRYPGIDQLQLHIYVNTKNAYIKIVDIVASTIKYSVIVGKE